MFCTPAQARELHVVAGTSLIEDIVNDLMAGNSQTLTIVQGSSCPGHDHNKTRDFIFAAKADVVLIHAFQRNMAQFTDMLAAVGKAEASLVVLEERGSWLVPEIQKKAVRSIAEVLKKAVPQQAEDIESRTQRRIAKVDSVAAECRELLVPVQGKAVVAAAMQADFVTWAGLRVARTYGRAEDMSAKGMVEILAAVQNTPLSGVIDNYQSGPDAGLPLALELRVAHTTLSNFPGSAPSTPDYFSLLRANVGKLAAL